MMSRIISIAIIALFAFSCSQKEKTESVALWYDQPAGKWMEALPIGKGSFGAVIYGGTSQEMIKISYETFL